ncbi:RraA family protein [Streptomyces sp. NPDC050759]|uniref:RraA family protein n=1 Tax=Streptomyces sp. NPDC050759 TaxID=3365635 RepID=UPI003799FB6C
MAETPERMLKLGTSTLYEAGRPLDAVRAMSPTLRPVWSGATLCGPAVPVTCGSGDNLAVHRAIERSPAGSVLAVNGGGALVGYWGEVLTAAAQYQGITGVIIDGGARDVDALRERGFPVFSRGVGMPGAYKRESGSVGLTTDVGGVPVSPGDFVVADADGVLVIAREHVEQVLLDAEERAAHETELMTRIQNGERTIDLFGLRCPTVP